jgi:hypothetical protein
MRKVFGTKDYTGEAKIDMQLDEGRAARLMALLWDRTIYD